MFNDEYACTFQYRPTMTSVCVSKPQISVIRTEKVMFNRETRALAQEIGIVNDVIELDFLHSQPTFVYF